MTRQIESIWVLKNAVVWVDVWELALSWWKVICLRWLVSLISWKTTGKQMGVYHSELTILRWFSGTIATCPVFPKKTGNHLLGSASCSSNFCSIWLILKHPYSLLLFTFGFIRVNPRFITCHDVINVFRSIANVFLEHFFRPIDTNLLWAIDKLCRIQYEQIFLTVKCSCNIKCMLVPLMPKVVSILR